MMWSGGTGGVTGAVPPAPVVGGSVGAAVSMAVVLAVTAASPLAGQGPLERGAPAFRGPGANAVEAVERVEEIRIDGRLTEAAWQTAPAIDAFVQGEPLEGGEPGARTVVRVLYDDHAIYIGARMYEPDPSRIARQLVRRDETGQADYFEVMFDPNLDRRTGYLFRVSAAGVQRDAYLHQDAQQDDSWDAVWASEVHVDSLGWSVEMRIPWSQIRYEPTDEPQTWGVNFSRWRVAAGERTYHALIPRNQHGRVSFARPMTGIRAPRNVRRIELRPYVLARGHTGPAEPGDPFFTGRHADARTGVDLRYGLGTAFTLDATVNPDFGQVEVDPAVINLTAFETFYSERRPFFVEDARIFDFSLSGRRSQLFYSRRIGREPQGRAPAGATHAEIPDGTTILGAAKLTGRTASGLSLGALAAVTGEAVGRAHDPGGAGDEGGGISSFPAEPRTYHGVVRARQDLRAGSTTVGGIVAGIRRDLPGDGTLDFLASDAVTGGVDFEHLWAGRAWALSGFVVGSLVWGDSTALLRIQQAPSHYWQRPDSRRSLDPSRTSLPGYNWRLGLARRSGRHWTGDLAVGRLGPGFEINDLGFSSASEHMETNASVSYRDIEPGRLFREYRLRASTFQNFGPAALDRPLELDGWRNARQAGSLWFDANFTLNNFWEGYAEVAFRPESFDPTATRGGPVLQSPPSKRLIARINTDRRNAVSIGTSADYQWGDAFSIFETGVDLAWRPAPRFELNIGPELAIVSSRDQYVSAFDDPAYQATYGRRYLFGDLERRTLSMPTRVAVTFTRDLTLQVFAQPLLDAGRYTAYKQLEAARTFDFHTFEPGTPTDHSGDGFIDGCHDGDICLHQGRHFVDASGDGLADHVFADRDFNVVSLRGNAVLRWEYRPGSTLFLVWQQRRFEQRPFGDFDPARDHRDILGVPPDNVFIVKVNYWLGL
jgi:hypothetical protein